MAYTYSKIATVTVGSGGSSSIDFLAIPQNYTDLNLVYSVRCDAVQTTIVMSYNGSTANRSVRYLYGNGSSVASGNAASMYVFGMDSSDLTANTFGNGQIYIPNYAGSTYKSASNDAVYENNATAAQAVLAAELWSDTTAINRVTLTPISGNFAQYSTATLYGIKAEV